MADTETPEPDDAEAPEPTKPEPWLAGVIARWKAGTTPTEDEARAIAQLWLDDMEGDDLEETDLAGFINDGTVDPDLKDWVQGMLESLGPEAGQNDSQREQAGELGAWLAYLDSV